MLLYNVIDPYVNYMLVHPSERCSITFPNETAIQAINAKFKLLSQTNAWRSCRVNPAVANDLLRKRALQPDRAGEWLIGWHTFLGYYIIYTKLQCTTSAFLVANSCMCIAIIMHDSVTIAYLWSRGLSVTHGVDFGGAWARAGSCPQIIVFISYYHSLVYLPIFWFPPSIFWPVCASVFPYSHWSSMSNKSFMTSSTCHPAVMT